MLGPSLHLDYPFPTPVTTSLDFHRFRYVKLSLAVAVFHPPLPSWSPIILKAIIVTVLIRVLSETMIVTKVLMSLNPVSAIQRSWKLG